MSTIPTATMDVAPVLPMRSRVVTILSAFWHMLRRDITVTAREVFPFAMQVLVQPFFLLFFFGLVLPETGVAQQTYPAFFLPGVVALNVVMAAIQGVTISLMLDLSTSREIDDRLLAPLPVSLVAVEKIVFSVLRSMVSGAITLPLAYLILGSGYQVRTDAILPLIGIMLLAAFASAALGLVLGTVVPADKIYLLFTIIFSAISFTGCVYYTWSGVGSLKVLQIITLFNPLTYASEGLRAVMVPAMNGQPVSTLPMIWVVLGLSIAFVVFLAIGLRAFYKRVIS